MYEPSKSILNTHIAGFAHWDGLEALAELDGLSLGAELKLKIEPDNPYDSQAVALYFEDWKLGYLPASKNEEIFRLLYFGYVDAFIVYVNRIDCTQHPERQIGISVQLVDRRRKVGGA